MRVFVFVVEIGCGWWISLKVDTKQLFLLPLPPSLCLSPQGFVSLPLWSCIEKENT